MDYVEQLLKAVNEYNDDDLQSQNALRDLVCIVSDNEELKKNPLIRNILYVASQKMRVFGYNIQNKLYDIPALEENNLSTILNESVKQNYRSKVWSNNILDKTQKEIVDLFQSLNTKRMLVSAPTSYGKTFIMREIIYINKNRYKNILLIFPTVALLRENAENMEQLNSDKNLGYTIIKSVDEKIGKRNIFVFTPERAIQLISNYPELKIDFFFYDEMYKIDEDFCPNEQAEDKENHKGAYKRSPDFLNEERAKTFRICLYLLSKQVPEYYLAGPNLSEDFFDYGMQEYIIQNAINIKTVTFEPTKRIRVDAYGTKIKEYVENLPIGSINDIKIRSKVKERICDIVSYIQENKYGQTLLYCTSPSKANSYATMLAQSNYGKNISDEDYRVFLDHIKRTYDINGSISHWSFWNVLQKGFAMHHGKLPKYIQKEVLELFNKGIFDFLFCTSTIVEGVNTNAKNMIILNHTKGGNPLTAFDVKNIIGRAGRYYHNFIGRYFLFDKQLTNIVNNNDMKLDFAIYGKNELDGVDLDNAEMCDLTQRNQQLKQDRVESQSEYNLPEEVFEKNRTIKKEYQEQLLNHLITHNQDFNAFLYYLKFPDILIQFTKYPALNVMLKIFESAGLMDSSTVGLYSALSQSYSIKGFKGVLSYQIDMAEKGNIKYDSAYSKAFNNQRDIIENKIPKILALFESIFAYAAERKNVKLNNFSLSKVIRFYETGVRSYFGEQLVEFGFPIDAIRKIEEKHKILLNLERNDIKGYIIEHQYDIESLLDKYEIKLLRKAIKSF